MQLDHATIVSEDLATVRQFLIEVAGLQEGPRPPFRFEGYWLYLDGRPVVHLAPATREGIDGLALNRIDHIAFRIGSRGEWAALLARLDARKISHHVSSLPPLQDVQLFVSIAPGVGVEFVTALANVVGQTTT
ncbi:VOC family protein [Cupriavidus numazuensis]|uniref:VOC domain-containing protein n=1 Tax=Cupriavidus numazuensis TaxID=221992 RepID=A0ABN7Q5I8_9BURK|nr:extradiol dioxygenase [Cupriavidus numazuensis]CAG2157950.1 hypothetical protein LMG26411_05770 [Cupriavidus numazuensis]